MRASRIALALAFASVVALAATGSVLYARGGSDDDVVTAATVRIRYSRFEPERIVVRAGEPVTITVRNDDPVEHEWILGPEELHEKHRTGTEAVHNEHPNEVTVSAYGERTTTLTFNVPGEYKYICHLPGHEAYGMVGTLVVK